MKLFKRKPAPEAVLVQQLMDQLRRADEHNCSLQKELQEERGKNAALQTALQVAVDHSWCIQEQMDVKTLASKLQAEAFREKQKELDIALAQNQCLVQERTQLKACLCLQNTKICSLEDQMVNEREQFNIVKDALKASYGQLKVTTARLKAKVSAAKQQLQEQEQVSRKALDLKEQETTALQNDLREERERSGVLQEELNKLQEEKIQVEMNMEELKNVTAALQTELKKEQGRNQQLQEEVRLQNENSQTLAKDFRQLLRNVEREMTRDAENARVQAENSMDELRTGIAAVQNQLKAEKRLNQGLQEVLCKMQENKALKIEHERSAKEARDKAQKSMVELMVETIAHQNELRKERKRNQALHEELCHCKNVPDNLKDIISQSEEKVKKLQEEKHAMEEVYMRYLEEARENLEELRNELHLKTVNSARLEREVTETREQLEQHRSQYQEELQSLKSALDMKDQKHLTEPRPIIRRTTTFVLRPNRAPQVQSTTEQEGVLIKTEESGPNSNELQTEEQLAFTRHTRVIFNPKH